MTESHDPVDAAIQAFLDHLEGGATEPDLDHLNNEERHRAEAIIESLRAGRGIDPYASRPSIEGLLAGTPLEGLLRTASDTPSGVVDLSMIHDVLATIDDRAIVKIDTATDGIDTVVYSYLDLQARFILIDVEGDGHFVTDETRSSVEALFRRDADTTRVGIVAGRSVELVTQLLAPDDVGDTVTAPRGAPHTRWAPPLPLALAARQMLEECAPEWQAFDSDRSLGDALDVETVAADIAAGVIGREAARSYRGEKARAYRSLVSQETDFASLVALVSGSQDRVDLDAETTRIARTAA